MVEQDPTTDDITQTSRNSQNCDTVSPNLKEIARTLERLADIALINGALRDKAAIKSYENAQEYAEYLRESDEQDVSRLSLHYSNGATQPVVIESTDELDRFDEPDIEEGSIVRDTEPADWMVKAGKNSFVVREVTDMSADEYYFDEDITVAEANPNHPPKAPVAVIERDNTELAYPVTRLENME